MNANVRKLKCLRKAISKSVCTYVLHGVVQSRSSSFWLPLIPTVSKESSCFILEPDSPSHRGSGITAPLSSFEMRLVAISVSLNLPNIVFLYTRLAMIFAIKTLGTQKTVRRMVGSEWLYSVITATRFMVTVVLSKKEQLVSWLSTKQIREVLITSSRPVRLVTLPWKTSAGNRQRSRLWGRPWTWDERKNYGTSAMIWQGKHKYHWSGELWLPSSHKTWLLRRCSILLVQYSLHQLQLWQSSMRPQQPAIRLQKTQLCMGSYRIRLECGWRKGEMWMWQKGRKGPPSFFQADNTY